MTIAKQEVQQHSGRSDWFDFALKQVAAYQARRRTAQALIGRSAHLLKDVGMTRNDVSDFGWPSPVRGLEALRRRAKERSGNW